MCWYLDMQGRAIMLRHPSNSYIVPLQFTRIRGKSQLKLYSTRGYTGTSKSDKKRRDLCMHTHACLRIMSETSLKQRENVIQNGREYCLFRYCILGTNYYCLTETVESREKIEWEKNWMTWELWGETHAFQVSANDRVLHCEWDRAWATPRAARIAHKIRLPSPKMAIVAAVSCTSHVSVWARIRKEANGILRSQLSNDSKRVSALANDPSATGRTSFSNLDHIRSWNQRAALQAESRIERTIGSTLVIIWSVSIRYDELPKLDSGIQFRLEYVDLVQEENNARLR